MKSLNSGVVLCHKTAPQKSIDTLTKFPAHKHNKYTPPGHRVSTPQQAKDSRTCPQGGLVQRFKIGDNRRLEKIATSEQFKGWLKIFEVEPCDRIGTQRRWKVSVWSEAERCYRVIAGQFFKPEIDWIQEEYRQARDKGRFALAIELWLQRAIEACSGAEVAA